MSNNQNNRRSSIKKNKIFISFARENSKEIAKALKNVLETKVFAGFNLECFVSDLDIASGEDWWIKIRKELKSCKMGILCITKENLNAPWIYYEAGAMVAQNLSVIPLLISCDFQALSSTPIKNQATNFYDQAKFLEMLCIIKRKMGFNTLTDDQVKTLGKVAYSNLKTELEPVLSKLRDMRVFNEKYVYPNTVNAIRKNTIYVSAPMSSISPDEYKELRDFILRLEKILKKVGFTDVFCPILEKEDPNHFDGKTKAVKDNFPLLKETDSLLIIYPKRIPSSALIESGYGIALSKKMVIFYNVKEGLPYMLQNADKYIPNINAYQFTSYTEIEQLIESDGMVLFEAAQGVIEE